MNSSPKPLHAVRQDPSRMLPHSLEAEEAVLGAMLLSAEAIANVISYLTPDAFWKPAHHHIYRAIVTVAEAGHRVDALTVANALKTEGLLEAVGGSPVLVDLQAGTPSTSNALHYAVIVLEHWEQRRALIALADATTAIHEGVTPGEAVTRVVESVADALSSGSSWTPADLGPLWDAPSDQVAFAPPILGKRADGACIAAPGATGLLMAAPEAGKSLAALAWCVEAAAMGRNSLYVDFESRVDRVMARLRMHQRSGLCQGHFAYINPRTAMSAADRWAIRRLMAETNPLIVVIDGYNALLAKHKLDGNSATDISALAEMVVQPFTGQDTCTVLIDHINKDDAKNPRANAMAIGSVAKTGLVDWALMLTPNPTNRIRKGAVGESLMTIAKDRDGELRHLANGRNEFGRFRVNSTKTGAWNHHIAVPDGFGDEAPVNHRDDPYRQEQF